MAQVYLYLAHRASAMTANFQIDAPQMPSSGQPEQWLVIGGEWPSRDKRALVSVFERHSQLIADCRKKRIFEYFWPKWETI